MPSPEVADADDIAGLAEFLHREWCRSSHHQTERCKADVAPGGLDYGKAQNVIASAWFRENQRATRQRALRAAAEKYLASGNPDAKVTKAMAARWLTQQADFGTQVILAQPARHSVDHAEAAPVPDHDCDSGYFDRSLCACGAMHSYCATCGAPADPCPYRDEREQPEGQSGQEADEAEPDPDICHACGTWTCASCGWWRPYANRFASQRCPDCGSDDRGSMEPVRHRHSRRTQHHVMYLEAVREGGEWKWPIALDGKVMSR